MKKLIRNSLFTFILGFSLCFVLTNAYSYNAKDISFSPSNNNWKVNSVKSAIDSIKNTNDTIISNLEALNSEKDAQITALQNRTLTFDSTSKLNYANKRISATPLNLTKSLSNGTYLISVVYGQPGIITTSDFDSDLENNELAIVSCTNTSNCDISETSSYKKRITSTSYNPATGKYYSYLVVIHKTFLVKVKTQSETINVNSNTSSDDNYATSISEILSSQITKVSIN